MNASSRKLCQNVAHFQIVSVLVYGKKGCAIPTYALLDSASEVTMIHTDLAEELGVKGSPKTLIMNSISGESTHKSEVISLRVRDRNDLDAETVYIKDVWTVSFNTFTDMKQYVQPEWIHVQDLNIPNIHPQQVKMLIGINMPKVHIQSDIRVGRDDQPIAVRTVLGWSLLGTTSQKLNEAVQAKVNLIVQRDVALHEQIEQFAKTESFGIIQKDKIPTSVEERRLLQILENTTQLRDDHSAKANKPNFSSTAVNTVQRDFIVDDLITSVDTTSTAIPSTRELSELLHKGGFHLHKRISNSHDVMKTITNTERAVTDVDLELDNLPVQPTLRLKSNVTEDAFVFTPKLENQSLTKHRVVSVFSSVFDPCVFLLIFVLWVKCVIQELWRKGLDWDKTIPYAMQLKWMQWLSEVKKLNTLKITQHHTALTSNVQQTEIHMFSDASEWGFGAVAYLRYTIDNNIVCSFIAAKSSEDPIKPVLSIPRLELQESILAVRLWNSVSCEIGIPIIITLFWTDSTTVLHYVSNKTKWMKEYRPQLIVRHRRMTHQHPDCVNDLVLICDNLPRRQWELGQVT